MEKPFTTITNQKSNGCKFSLVENKAMSEVIIISMRINLLVTTTVFNQYIW